jgi:hypothetical protein
MPEQDTARHIVIFGAYKSGTTGLFSVVRRSLHPEPRVFFESPEYLPKAGDDGRHLLAKVILGVGRRGPISRPESFGHFDRQILLCRDPRDWLVSGMLFMIQQHEVAYRDMEVLHALLSLLRRKEADPLSISFGDLFNAISTACGRGDAAAHDAWIECQLASLIAFKTRQSRVHVFRYEDFVGGKWAALEEYLDLPLARDTSVGPEHKHVPRTLAAGDWRNWFLPEDVERFRPLLLPYMRCHGYADNWEVTPPASIAAEHGSSYVARTVALRLKPDVA